MPRINMANIQSALGKVKDAAAPLQNQGHTENVPVEYIHPSSRNIFNETDTDESIKELADDIAACGLEHPIAVNKIASDNYRIISGERRYRAMTEYLHRKTIPCMVFENLSEDQEQLRLFMANLSVREYTASQKYRFYLEVKTLLEKMKASGEYKGGMQKGIADILNVTKRQVARYSSIEKLPVEIQEEILDGSITLNRALEIAGSKGRSEAPSDKLKRISEMLSELSDEERSAILSGGEVENKENRNTVLEKDDIGHLFGEDGTAVSPKNEDRIPKKDDMGHRFGEDSTAASPKNEDMIESFQDKDEPAPNNSQKKLKTKQRA